MAIAPACIFIPRAIQKKVFKKRVYEGLNAERMETVKAVELHEKALPKNKGAGCADTRHVENETNGELITF